MGVQASGQTLEMAWSQEMTGSKWAGEAEGEARKDNWK